MSALDHERLENSILGSKMGKLEERLSKIESQSRHENLLFDGVYEMDPEVCEALVRNILRINLKLNNVDSIQIVRCHRLGPKRRNAQRSCTIITKFQWFGDRMKVWQARKHLKGTRTFINEDFPKEILEKRRVLRPIMPKTKASGKSAFLNVYALSLRERGILLITFTSCPQSLTLSCCLLHILVVIWWPL